MIGQLGVAATPLAGEMAEPFAAALRRARGFAAMTQEELAQAARISPRSVSDLERGISVAPRIDTARRLADALRLAGPDRAAFLAAARRRLPEDGELAASPAPPTAALQTLPRDTSSFTGRKQELALLLNPARAAAEIFTVGGMAGAGKTALAVHAAHLLAPRYPDGQIFLPLHGHTPGRDPVAPGEALAILLQSVGVAAQNIPAEMDARAGMWRDRVARKHLLLCLDDAVGHEQVTPLLPGTPGCLILITSRRHLAAIEDARIVNVGTLSAAEAATLMSRLAEDRHLDPEGTEARQLARLCGNLPLAIGIVARRLSHHPTWPAARLAADMTGARSRLELLRAENVSVAAAFDLSFRDLTPDQQHFFRILGLFPGTEIDAYAAAALAGTQVSATSRYLEDLFDNYLLTETTPGRYSLHDLIADHAHALATADELPADSDAIERLMTYYLHCALEAGRPLTRRTPAGVPAIARPLPRDMPDLCDGDDATAWMNVERANLLATARLAATTNRMAFAVALAAALHGYLRHHGDLDQLIAVHQSALMAARRSGNQHAEASVLTDLGDARYLSGRYQAAIDTLTQAQDLYEQLGDDLGQAGPLCILGNVQGLIGHYESASALLDRALDLSRRHGDRLGQAAALAYQGNLQLSIPEAQPDHDGPDNSPRPSTDPAASLQTALELYHQLGNRLGEARTSHYLGISHRRTGNYPAAQRSLTRAIELYQALDSKLGEAKVLNSLGEAEAELGNPDQAYARHHDALAIATHIASQLEQARALEGIGYCQILMNRPDQAVHALRRAQTIYQRLGSPNATRVSALLHSATPA